METTNIPEVRSVDDIRRAGIGDLIDLHAINPDSGDSRYLGRGTLVGRRILRSGRVVVRVSKEINQGNSEIMEETYTFDKRFNNSDLLITGGPFTEYFHPVNYDSAKRSFDGMGK